MDSKLSDQLNLPSRFDLASEKAIIQVFTVRFEYLSFHRFCMPDLAFSFSELDVRCGQIRELRLVKAVTVLELLLQNAQVWPPLLQSRYVLLRDLRLDLRCDEACLSLLHRGQVLVSQLALLLRAIYR